MLFRIDRSCGKCFVIKFQQPKNQFYLIEMQFLNDRVRSHVKLKIKKLNKNISAHLCDLNSKKSKIVHTEKSILLNRDSKIV